VVLIVAPATKGTVLCGVWIVAFATKGTVLCGVWIVAFAAKGTILCGVWIVAFAAKGTILCGGLIIHFNSGLASHGAIQALPVRGERHYYPPGLVEHLICAQRSTST
jgi:hypothetical protein